ncbi:hypothetical protein [Campylobacter pinnipediorum]|uniref:hypothetical protein n=1 Tax=Campylobacter pinnipediorum TaxID=1965231 RepID=UPI0012FF6316|nr:hypothetical protein [Campylobacter pinnipediorum]
MYGVKNTDEFLGKEESLQDVINKGAGTSDIGAGAISEQGNLPILQPPDTGDIGATDEFAI